MKLQVATAVAAFAVALVASPASVSAANCTDNQLEAFAELDQAALETACPSLFLDDENEIDPSKLDTFTTETLQAVAPCKEKTCLSELTKMVEDTPDCTAHGLNIRMTNAAMLKLCTAFSAGPVTVNMAVGIFKDVSKNMTDAFETLLKSDGSRSDGSSMEIATPSPSKTKAANSSNSASTTTKPSSTKPSAAVASPVPATTTKSEAKASNAATLAVFATTFVAANLLL
jgi:hypothetical protein